MIAAIADDFTGAAELAGVGVRYGLSAEVHTALGLESAAEMTIMDTDSRDGGAGQARDRAASAARWLGSRGPALAYKKVDSLLRGWVRAELDALLETLSAPRALVVFANPSRGRIVREARCFVDGWPVDETELARDPHHPVRSSDVRDMLGPSGAAPVFVRRWDEPLPPRGIVVGEASTRDDLMAWARRLPEDAVAAGAAEFFDALLEAKGRRRRPAADAGDARSPTLLVCGSGSARGQGTLHEAGRRGIPVLVMPDALLREASRADVFESWVESVCAGLRRTGAAVVGVGRAERITRGPELAGRLADLAARVLGEVRIGHVLAEGGATAAALARRLGWSCLSVRREVAPGIVTLQARGEGTPRLTVKPGSYAWPPRAWEWLSGAARAG